MYLVMRTLHYETRPTWRPTYILQGDITTKGCLFNEAMFTTKKCTSCCTVSAHQSPEVEVYIRTYVHTHKRLRRYTSEVTQHHLTTDISQVREVPTPDHGSTAVLTDKVAVCMIPTCVLMATSCTVSHN